MRRELDGFVEMCKRLREVILRVFTLRLIVDCLRQEEAAPVVMGLGKLGRELGRFLKAFDCVIGLLIALRQGPGEQQQVRIVRVLFPQCGYTSGKLLHRKRASFRFQHHAKLRLLESLPCSRPKYPTPRRLFQCFLRIAVTPLPHGREAFVDLAIHSSGSARPPQREQARNRDRDQNTPAHAGTLPPLGIAGADGAPVRASPFGSHQLLDALSQPLGYCFEVIVFCFPF